MSRHYEFCYSPEILAKLQSPQQKHEFREKKRGYCINRYKLSNGRYISSVTLKAQPKLTSSTAWAMNCTLWKESRGPLLVEGKSFGASTDRRALGILLRAVARIVSPYARFTFSLELSFHRIVREAALVEKRPKRFHNMELDIATIVPVHYP